MNNLDSRIRRGIGYLAQDVRPSTPSVHDIKSRAIPEPRRSRRGMSIVVASLLLGGGTIAGAWGALHDPTRQAFLSIVESKTSVGTTAQPQRVAVAEAGEGTYEYWVLSAAPDGRCE